MQAALGPSWHTGGHCPRAPESSASPHSQGRRPQAQPPAQARQGYDGVGVPVRLGCRRSAGPHTPQKPREEKQSSAKQPSQGPGAGEDHSAWPWWLSTPQTLKDHLLCPAPSLASPSPGPAEGRAQEGGPTGLRRGLDSLSERGCAQIPGPRKVARDLQKHLGTS